VKAAAPTVESHRRPSRRQFIPREHGGIPEHHAANFIVYIPISSADRSRGREEEIAVHWAIRCTSSEIYRATENASLASRNCWMHDPSRRIIPRVRTLKKLDALFLSHPARETSCWPLSRPLIPTSFISRFIIFVFFRLSFSFSVEDSAIRSGVSRCVFARVENIVRVLDRVGHCSRQILPLARPFHFSY